MSQVGEVLSLLGLALIRFFFSLMYGLFVEEPFFAVLLLEQAVLRLGIKFSHRYTIQHEEKVNTWRLIGLQKRIFVSSAIIVAAIVLTVVLAYSAEAVATFASINPIGVVAAMCAAVVGFVWFLKKS